MAPTIELHSLWLLLDEAWEHVNLANRLHALDRTGWPRLLTFERRVRATFLGLPDPARRALAATWLAAADRLVDERIERSRPRACLAVALGRDAYTSARRGERRAPVHALGATLFAMLLAVEDLDPNAPAPKAVSSWPPPSSLGAPRPLPGRGSGVRPAPTTEGSDVTQVTGVRARLTADDAERVTLASPSPIARPARKA